MGLDCDFGREASEAMTEDRYFVKRSFVDADWKFDSHWRHEGLAGLDFWDGERFDGERPARLT